LPFRAISTSPHETSEIAGFAPHTWCRIRDAGQRRLDKAQGREIVANLTL
jgi:hypothetical protein